MKLVLLNSEVVDLGGDTCNRGHWTEEFRSYANQAGMQSYLQVNQHCDPFEVLSEHNDDGSFFVVGKKAIPVRSVLYIEESLYELL